MAEKVKVIMYSKTRRCDRESYCHTAHCSNHIRSVVSDNGHISDVLALVLAAKDDQQWSSDTPKQNSSGLQLKVFKFCGGGIDYVIPCTLLFESVPLGLETTTL